MSTNTSTSPERSRPRKSSTVDPPESRPTGHAPATTFFLRRERDLQPGYQEKGTQALSAEDVYTTPDLHTPQDMADSSYGVQSLAETLEGAFPGSSQRELSTSTTDAHQESSLRLSQTPSREDNTISGRKRKAGNPVHPKIAAAAQRIISSERPSSRASSTSSTFRVPSSNSPFREHLRKTSNASLNPPLTPLRLSPNPDSVLSGTPRSASPRSFRLSDEEGSIIDETGSQAIQSSSGEEEEDDTLQDTGDATAGALEDSAGPQLRMPSITMPSRRPFTERGKRMGRLKILVAGPAGVGKTSLIRSIVQTCEDIVHVDPSEKTTSGYPSTTQITEVSASTKAYPAWWSEVEESRTLRRRKSMGDVVLERNICFVDTPGGSLAGTGEQPGAWVEVEHYLESLLRQNTTIDVMSDSALLALLSGGGGLQVDAILYMFQPGMSKCQSLCAYRSSSTDGFTDESSIMEQVAIVGRLSCLTNVIPLIGCSDGLPKATVEDLKTRINNSLSDEGITPFNFQLADPAARNLGGGGSRSQFVLPLAVSSAPGDDAEVMDASLLMSSGYLKPLLASDLSILVEALFEPDNMQWIRHCAVRKFLSWRKRQTSALSGLETHTSHLLPGITAPSSAISDRNTSIGLSGACSTVSSPSQVLVPYPASSFYRSHSPSPSTLSANVPHHTSDLILPNFNHTISDHYTEVRLAKWAEDLQRSLEHDRRQQSRVHNLQHGGDWALDLPSTQEKDQMLTKHNNDRRTTTTINTNKNNTNSSITTTAYTPSPRGLNPQDPLGILAFTQQFRRTGLLTLQILGGCGIVGAAAIWAIRNWATVSEFFGFPAGILGGGGGGEAY